MVKHKEDLAYVKSLAEGGAEAWGRFYSVNREKIGRFLSARYPGLGATDVEEVCDSVQTRLTKNNYKALKEYRGECSFESYIMTATGWAVKDWFKANSSKLLQVPLDENNDSDKSQSLHNPPIEESNTPELIKSLPDDLRQAFLLRYYDDFGFPPEEIRLLAQRTGRQIREITEVMIKYFSSEGENLLIRRRKEKSSLETRLQRCSFSISTLKRTEEKLSKKMASCSDKRANTEIETELKEIEVKIISLERRRDIIYKEVHAPTKAPYEIIAEVMSIDSVSTIRSWVKKAKELLAESLRKNHRQMSL